MARPKPADLPALITRLVAAEIELIVVGGAACVLQGALTMTQDLDVVHRTTEKNVGRLLKLLRALDAYVREPGARRLKPDAALLAGRGQVRLITSLGPLDLLGRLHDGRSYDELLPHTEILTDGKRRIQVIDLPTLIEIKTAAGRTKDQLVVPLLLALLRRRSRKH